MATFTVRQLSEKLGKDPLYVRNVQKTLNLHVPDGEGYSLAYLRFLRKIIALRTFSVPMDDIVRLFEIEKKLLRLLRADTHSSSPTWYLDACAGRGQHESRLLLTGYDLGVPVAGGTIQTSLDFGDMPPELFEGEEMGEDIGRILDQYLKLVDKTRHRTRNESPILRHALSWARQTLGCCLLWLPVFLITGCGSIDRMADLNTYPIRMHRPERVGDRVQATIEARSSVMIHVYDETDVIEESFEDVTYTFAGEIKNLAVGTNGLAWKIEITIDHLIRKKDNKDTSLLPHNTVVVVWDDGSDQQCTVGETPLDDATRRPLGIMFALRRKQTTADQLYPAGTPKRLGETWSVDRDVAAREAAEYGLSIDPENITGQATLTAVTGPPNARIIQILTETTSRRAILAQPGPFGLKTVTHMHRADLHYPVDAFLPPTAWSWERTLHFSGRRRRAPDGPILKMECVFSDHIKGHSRTVSQPH